METAKNQSEYNISPDDVKITEDGKIQVINPNLADKMKTMVLQSKRPVVKKADSNNGCGNNVYQCGKK